MPSPLEVALQEYVYWRDTDFPQNPHWNDIQLGATAAAANIAGRIGLNDVPIEGIRYADLTPAQILVCFTQLRLARQMAEALIVVHQFFAKLEDGLPEEDPLTNLRRVYHAPIHAVLDPLIDELRKAGVL